MALLRTPRPMWLNYSQPKGILKVLKKIVFVGVMPLLLSACIGSKFVVDDADNSAKFPDLHDVPERPVIKERAKEALTKDEINQTQEEDLSENERLRKEYGL